MNEAKIALFPDLRTLAWEKDRLRRENDEWQERQRELREFYNGQPIMTDDDADEESLEKITNHLIGYSNMQVVETRYYGLWANSNKLLDVNITDPNITIEDRQRMGDRINKYLNMAIYKTTRFGAFWRTVSGELALAGRAACINKEDADWCPSVSPKIYLPDDVGTDASELTYAFAPREMSIHQLQQLLEGEEPSDDEEGDEESVKLDGEVEVNKDVVEELVATIKRQIEDDDRQMNTGGEKEHHEPTNEDGVVKSNNTTVSLYNYYEVRWDEDSKSKVVDLLIFTDEFRIKADGDDEGDTRTIQEWVAFYPAYYSRPPAWLNLIVADASIGGDKRFATAKGPAEIAYNSDLDSEELVNRMFTGEKMRAMPRFQKGDSVDEDKLLGWSPEDSTLVPEGVSEFKFGGGTGGLHNPLSLLRQNSAQLSGGSISNNGRGGELRQQAVERQSNTQAASSTRIGDVFKSMEIIGQEMVARFFVGETEGGDPGYEEIMWFRKKISDDPDMKIDLKRLAEMSFGFFDNIEVKIVKSSTSGEIDHDLQVARALMDNLQNYPPAVRPFIVRKFTSLISGDPDFADQLVELLPKIVSAQRVTAESEFEQVARDSSVGIDTPVGVDDVHQEHAATHNKHLRIILNRHRLRGWTREDALHFAGMQQHQQQHIDELLLNGTTSAEGEGYLKEFQELIAEGDRYLAEVDQNERDANGQSQQEFDNAITLAEQERKEKETEIKEREQRDLSRSRDERQASVNRKGDQQFLVQSKAVENQEQKNRQDTVTDTQSDETNGRASE